VYTCDTSTYHAELAHKLNTTAEGLSSDRGDKSYVSQLQGRPISKALGEPIREDCIQLVAISLDFKLLGTIAGFAHQLLPQHGFGLSNVLLSDEESQSEWIL
jgi:hypothetical protein